MTDSGRRRVGLAPLDVFGSTTLLPPQYPLFSARTCPPSEKMTIRVSITDLSFSDGTSLVLGPDDVVAVVGPNNAGKSATLRYIRDTLEKPTAGSPIVSSMRVEREGGAEELIEWLGRVATKRPGQPDSPYAAFGIGVGESSARSWWVNEPESLHSLTRFFATCSRLRSGSERRILLRA